RPHARGGRGRAARDRDRRARALFRRRDQRDHDGRSPPHPARPAADPPAQSGVSQHPLRPAVWRSHEAPFLPPGRARDIGMNLNLYGYAGKWLMVDLGVTFGDDSVPGIEVVMPDPTFIVERKDDLVGLVLTHAHEDHIGAVQYLWRRLKCPIYATAFTA